MPEIQSEHELFERLELLGIEDEQTKKKITCALLGHSKIQEFFLWQYSCSRCGEVVGDSLVGIYDAKDVVVVGHDCEICRSNYEKLTWKDKIFCPDPFAKSEVNIP